MDRKSAEVISDLFLRASNLCNASLYPIKQKGSLGQIKTYGRLVGQYMGNTYLNILAPIWKMYPELEPTEMKHKYEEPNATLDPECQKALEEFLMDARAALEVARNFSKTEQQVFAYGGLSEVEEAVDRIQEFLAQPRHHSNQKAES